MQGLLFHVPTGMLAAVIEDRKTKTRRLGGLKKVNKKPDDWAFVGFDEMSEGKFEAAFKKKDDKEGYTTVHCKPRLKKGEVVYVKESYHFNGYNNIYKVDASEDSLAHVKKKNLFKWSNAMFCPHTDKKTGLQVARTFLKIKSVRVERLNNITKEDSIKEGIGVVDIVDGVEYFGTRATAFYKNPIDAFMELIDKINGKGTGKSNPFVFVYEFEKNK